MPVQFLSFSYLPKLSVTDCCVFSISLLLCLGCTSGQEMPPQDQEKDKRENPSGFICQAAK